MMPERADNCLTADQLFPRDRLVKRRAHTTGGFLAAVVRKKLGLPPTCEKPEGGDRVYGIA